LAFFALQSSTGRWLLNATRQKPSYFLRIIGTFLHCCEIGRVNTENIRSGCASLAPPLSCLLARDQRSSNLNENKPQARNCLTRIPLRAPLWHQAKIHQHLQGGAPLEEACRKAAWAFGKLAVCTRSHDAVAGLKHPDACIDLSDLIAPVGAAAVARPRSTADATTAVS